MRTRLLPTLLLALLLVLSSVAGVVSAQGVSSNKSVTNAEVVYNDDGTISVTLTIADTNPIAIELVVNPQALEPGEQCISTGKSYNEALANFSNRCSMAVTDCDPYDGSWYCSSSEMSGKPPLHLLNDPATAAASVVEPTPLQEMSTASIVVSLPVPETTATGESEPSPSTADVDAIEGRGNGNNSDNGKIANNDLLALHYDNAPDPDDGHALVAGRTLKDFYGLENVVAVNGTHGYQRRVNFNQNSEALFKAAWPSGLNAFRDWAGSVATSAALWSETISQGGRVWVAEGGPMDFTADVLRAMPAEQRKRVTVVQHSHGWNEDNTRPDNVVYVENQSNYIRIDNGNLDGNSTAILNRKSAYFVQTALSSQWGSLWQAAFAYLSPNEKLDFSDTVEFLWLLDIPRSVVANPDDFANQFLR